MQQTSLESVSAMMDGEVESFELRRLVERSASDEEVSAKWQRYHLAQDILKGKHVQIDVPSDFAAGISSVIAQEPSYSAQDTVQAKAVASAQADSAKTVAWYKPLASMAVAASVTAVVILGAQQFDQAPVTAAVSADVAFQAPAPNQNLIQAQFANPAPSVESAPKIAYGMGQYVEQYRDLTQQRPSAWQVNWLPEGYQKVEHNVTKHAEVMLYSNGTSAVAINVEDLGTQVATSGVLSQGDVLALGQKVDKSFITVVGPLTEEVAQKIAASVEPVN
ncbi:MAG: MucB/RseB C-terminal domain-containing protein [Pseudomonadales bacterium]